MRASIKALLILAFISTSNSHSQEILRGGFSVMTYNVAGLPYWINDMDPYRFPLIGQKLNNYDLVMLQEDFWYHDDIKRTATFPHKSKPKVNSWGEWANGKLVNDGLNRFSRFPMQHFSRKPWGVCHSYGSDGKGGGADCLAAKGLSVARHKIKNADGDEFELDIYNVHMQSGSGSKPDDIRIRQATLLFKYMASFSPANPVIVVGDFNFSMGKTPDLYDTFSTEANLTDSYEPLGELQKQKWNRDRIFYRNSDRIKLKPVRYKSTQFYDSNSKPLSDHRPVIVWFDWYEVARESELTLEAEPEDEPETESASTPALESGPSYPVPTELNHQLETDDDEEVQEESPDPASSDSEEDESELKEAGDFEL